MTRCAISFEKSRKTPAILLYSADANHIKMKHRAYQIYSTRKLQHHIRLLADCQRSPRYC